MQSHHDLIKVTCREIGNIYYAGTKLAQNFREKLLLPPGILGRSLLILGRSERWTTKAGLSVLGWMDGRTDGPTGRQDQIDR